MAYKHHTDPEFRRALEKWLAAETEGMENRLEAVRAAAEVARLAAQVLDQRVMEARAYNRSWMEIAEALRITRQSAHKRWRHLESRARIGGGRGSRVPLLPLATERALDPHGTIGVII